MTSDNNEKITMDETTTTKKFHNPTPVLLSMMQNMDAKNPFSLSSVSLASTAAAVMLSVSIMLASPDAAWAARSGGRMGGSFGSAAPSMRVSPSRSYGGGGYRGGGGYYGGGYRGGVSVAPIITPYYAPPMVYGGGVGLFRGPSFFDLIFFGGFAYIVLSAITSTANGIASSGTELFTDSTTSVLGNGATVGKLSVALEVPNRDDSNSILSALDRLALTARTDSRVGIQDLTSQVALELLRRKSSIVSGYSQSQHFNDKSKAQRDFSLTAVQERGKFEQEIVSKYGGVDYGVDATSSSSAIGDKATMVVVTLVYAIDGDTTKMPKIRSIGDVEDALRRIAADAKVDECLQSTEILWTPQDRTETLTLREVIADYPELNSV